MHVHPAVKHSFFWSLPCFFFGRRRKIAFVNRNSLILLVLVHLPPYQAAVAKKYVVQYQVLPFCCCCCSCCTSYSTLLPLLGCASKWKESLAWIEHGGWFGAPLLLFSQKGGNKRRFHTPESPKIIFEIKRGATKKKDPKKAARVSLDLLSTVDRTNKQERSNRLPYHNVSHGKFLLYNSDNSDNTNNEIKQKLQ